MDDWTFLKKVQRVAREMIAMETRLAAQVAEITRLRAGIADLRIDHRDCMDLSGASWEDPRLPCECGANAHNAKIAALLKGEAHADPEPV